MNQLSKISDAFWLLKLKFGKLSSTRIALHHPVNSTKIMEGSTVLSEKGNRIFVDVSEIVKNDLGTGIQRVVRSYLYCFQKESAQFQDFEIVTVCATPKMSFRQISSDGTLTDIEIHPQLGDTFLALDFSPRILPKHIKVLLAWKLRGVRFSFFLYDILPLTNPEWFTSKNIQRYKHWLRIVTIFADQVLCISNTVKKEFERFLKCSARLDVFPQLEVVKLGSDLLQLNPKQPLNEKEQSILEYLAATNYVLMVGTIEPRKGHALVLNAFEYLWSRNHNIVLVVAGRPGWKTDVLQNRMLIHKEKNKRLYWLDHISNELLSELYQGNHCVVVASEAEGYGLPLVEALANDCRVLARNLPVFKEIAGDSVCYFEGNEIIAFADKLLSVMDMTITKKEAELTSWQLATNYLLKLLEKGIRDGQ